MGKFDKFLVKLLNSKSVITFQELEYLLGNLGYIEKKTGKTSGSRKAYVHEQTKHIIRIHKPHPGNEIKNYAKKQLIEELRKKNLI